MVTVHQLRQEILALQGGSPGLQMLVCVCHCFFLRTLCHKHDVCQFIGKMSERYDNNLLPMLKCIHSDVTNIHMLNSCRTRDLCISQIIDIISGSPRV